MPGLTGPLFSLSARGTLAKAITYSRWKGVKYARQRVIPANPDTTDQKLVRTSFAHLNAMYGYLPGFALSSYIAQARGEPLIPRNAFVRNNAKNLEVNDDYTDLQIYGHKGQVPMLVNPVITDNGGQVIRCVATIPTLPAGLSGGSFALAAAVKEGTHLTEQPWTFVEGFDAASPYQIDLAMGAAGTYHVAFCLNALDADGLNFYSVSFLQDQIVA